MSSVLFSIICPVYNAEKHVRCAVSSVINQTYNNWELILIDDGSSDSSGIICDEFKRHDSRIRVIHQRNQGQSRARLNGIKKSSGEYILFLDSDDSYCLSALETLKNILEKHHYDAILYNANKHSLDSVDTVYKFGIDNYLANDIYIECFCNRIAGYLWSYCFKKSLFDLPDDIVDEFCNIGYCEDVYLIFNIVRFHQEMKLFVISNQLYSYNFNLDSITRNQTASKVGERFDVFNYVYSEMILSKSVSLKMISSSVYTSIGWSSFSYVYRSCQEYDYEQFVKVCANIRDSFLFKNFHRFKKDKKGIVTYSLIMLKKYRILYKYIKQKHSEY